jgi:hypothetical protein
MKRVAQHGLSRKRITDVLLPTLAQMAEVVRAARRLGLARDVRLRRNEVANMEGRHVLARFDNCGVKARYKSTALAEAQQLPP